MIKLLEHTRRPDITFCRNGRILITARVARLLSLRPGDALNIAVTDGEYLLHAIHNPVGRYHAQCFPTKKGCGGNLSANSVHLCRALLKGAGITAHRASFLVGTPIEIDGITHLPIITRNPL